MKAIPLSEGLISYVDAHAMPVNPVLPDLIAETSKLPRAMMQITPSQGALMHLLAKLVGARRAIDVGCFTGYSAIAVAAALPADGQLYTLDVDANTAAIAQRYFAASGLEQRISLRLGPALDTLDKLLQEHGQGSFDLMFIDADKGNMVNYYERGLKLLRKGGLIIADNVLWGGSVLDPANPDADTKAIRAFNDHVAADERVDRVLINVADGLFLARKR